MAYIETVYLLRRADKRRRKIPAVDTLAAFGIGCLCVVKDLATMVWYTERNHGYADCQSMCVLKRYRNVQIECFFERIQEEIRRFSIHIKRRYNECVSGSVR